MSAKIEKENIAKLKECIEQYELWQKRGCELDNELQSLLRKKYPSNITDVSLLKKYLQLHGMKHLDIIKSMIDSENRKIVWDNSKICISPPVKKHMETCEVCGKEFELKEASENYRVDGWKLACPSCREEWKRSVNERAEQEVKEFMKKNPDFFE